jgi:hypothetical protein
MKRAIDPVAGARLHFYWTVGTPGTREKFTEGRNEAAWLRHRNESIKRARLFDIVAVIPGLLVRELIGVPPPQEPPVI